MKFEGTFTLKLINRRRGEIIQKRFRSTMKVIYLGACVAYIAEVAKQVPVLTGAARSAILWRLKQVITAAQKIDAELVSRLQIENMSDEITMSKTIAKVTPHQYPQIGWTNFREQWSQHLLQSGQTIQSWMSDNYVPMLINVGVGNQYFGRYKFFFAIKDFYLERYDVGTIMSSTYNVGAWELHKDGMQAFDKMFNQLFHLSGVTRFRVVLAGSPEAYRQQIAT